MTDNVIEFSGISSLDTDPDRILKRSMGRLEYVVVIGVDVDGEEYFASSKADGGEVIYALERAKYKLLKIIDEGV